MAKKKTKTDNTHTPSKQVSKSEFPILDSLDLFAVPIKGDGNCLFRSLSDQIHGNESEHAEIRKRVVSFLVANSERFAAFVGEFGETYDQYVNRMAQDGCYGGHMEIVAFAETFRCRVVIYQHDNLFVVDPLCLSDKEKHLQRSVHIAYHTWEHYSSVRSKKGPLQGPVSLQVPETVSYTKETDNINTVEDVPQWKVDIVTRCVPDIDEHKIRSMLLKNNYEEVIEKLIMPSEDSENRESSILVSSNADQNVDPSYTHDDRDKEKDDGIPADTGVTKATSTSRKKNKTVISSKTSSVKPHGKRKALRQTFKDSTDQSSVVSVDSSLSELTISSSRNSSMISQGTLEPKSNGTTGIEGQYNIDSERHRESKLTKKITGKQKRQDRKNRLRIKKTLKESNLFAEEEASPPEVELKTKIIHI